jgi:hypothetical protein
LEEEAFVSLRNHLLQKRKLSYKMKQLIQDLKNGNTLLEEVPVPQLKAGAVIIRTTRSLVSLGTERMLVEFGKASLHNGHSEEFRQSAQGDIKYRSSTFGISVKKKTP